MMQELFFFQIKKYSRLCVLAGLFMALLSLGAMLLFDEQTVVALSEVRASSPEFFSAFRIGSSSTLLDHIASLLHGFILPVLGSLLAIYLAGRLMPDLIERGEMAFYLSLPLHRTSFVLTQGAVLIAALTLTQLLYLGGTMVAALIVQPGALNMLWLVVLGLGQLCLWMLSAGIALMTACAQDERRPARSRAMLWIGVFYLVAMLGNIAEWPGFIRWLSPYSLLDTQSLAKGRFGFATLGMPMAGALCMLVGAGRFSKRDLPL